MELNSFFTHFLTNTFYNICISDFFFIFLYDIKILCYSYLEKKNVKFLKKIYLYNIASKFEEISNSLQFTIIIFIIDGSEIPIQLLSKTRVS